MNVLVLDQSVPFGYEIIWDSTKLSSHTNKGSFYNGKLCVSRVIGFSFLLCGYAVQVMNAMHNLVLIWKTTKTHAWMVANLLYHLVAEMTLHANVDKFHVTSRSYLLRM